MNVNVAWKSPAVFDDVIAITVECTHVGNTSYTLKVGFTNHQSGVEIASGEIVYVMLNTQENEKASIPRDMGEKLEKGAPNVLVDHGGVS